MTEFLYVFTLLVIAGTCLLIFGVRAWGGSRIIRTREAREEAYRELAAQCAASQSAAVSQLATLHDEIGRVGTRLAAIERVLASVD